MTLNGKMAVILRDITESLRQTDRILIARPRLHSMQRGKNDCHQWLSDRSRVYQIRFRPLLWFKRALLLRGNEGRGRKRVGEQRGEREEEGKRMGGKEGKGKKAGTPFHQFLRTVRPWRR